MTNIKKRILITGGLGFIGYEVACHLISEGHEVVLVDSLQTNVISVQALKAIHPQVEVFEMPIADYVKQYPQHFEHYNTVLHAASVVGAVKVIDYLGILADEMIHSTQLVANACLDSNVDLISISSSEVYGKSGLLVETDRLEINPQYNARIEYAIGKMATECLLSNLRHKGLRSIMLRPFNIVGPRQHAKTGFVLPNFIRQAIQGEPLTVYNDGQQERAFTSVIDMATFITQLIVNEKIIPDAINAQVLNVGNSNNRSTILDLAKLVNQVTGNTSGYRLVDPVEIHGDHFFESDSHVKLCNDQLARQFGWNPGYDLPRIIGDVHQFYLQSA
jgi:nucleoside-diphosphate-sugar epimerase